jgi:hypothetical protein
LGRARPHQLRKVDPDFAVALLGFHRTREQCVNFRLRQHGWLGAPLLDDELGEVDRDDVQFRQTFVQVFLNFEPQGFFAVDGVMPLKVLLESGYQDVVDDRR